MITSLTMKIIIITIIILHCVSIYIAHINGKQFYNDRKKKEKVETKIYDIAHKYLPKCDTDKIEKIETMMNVFMYLPFLWKPSMIYDYVSHIIPLYLFRSITTMTTILPKHKNCNDDEFKFFNFLNGHCYDKMFSGHYASVMIISLLMNRENIDTKIILMYNLISIFLILVTRGHYTIDVIMGGYIAATAFMLNINLDFIQNIVETK
jgi:hypothetical protein